MKFDKFELGCVMAAILAAGMATPAMAQESVEPGTAAPTPLTAAPETPASADEITVIGTRIKGLDLEGALPALQIDRQTINESGASSVVELLQDQPVTSGGAGTFSTATAGPLSGDTPVGASGVSLRGLGTSATLTLINGRRASVSAFAKGQESFIDVNSLPLAALERVEILPNGASALYGADAVAGVINYVLRKDFQGLELSASYGNSTASSNEARYNINAVLGQQLGDHHVMLVVDYFKRNPFFLRDRKISRDSVRPSQQGFYPSFNDLFLMTFDQTEEPQDGGCAAEDFDSGNLGEYCEVDNNDFVSASDRLETVSGLLAHNVDVNDKVKWSNELLFSHSKSRGTGSPANFSRAPIDPENPFWPQALQDDIVAEGGAFDFTDYYGYPIYAWGKLPEPRAVSVKSKSFRFTSILDVELRNGWNVETGLLFGGNNRTQRGLSGLVLARAFYDANLGNLCSDGTTAERWDVDLGRPDADYVGDTCEDIGKTTLWYNPFGAQDEQTAGLSELLDTEAERRGKSRMYQADINVSGDLFTVGERVIKAAFGAEVRRETLRDTPSGVAVATSDNPEPILGFSSTSARATRNQWSVYGELYVPVADRVDVQLAGRYDHYEDFGGDFNPKIAVRWNPADIVTFRANYATSFRAPSLAQSGAGVLLSSYRVDCAETPGACDDDPSADGEALLSEDVGNVDLQAENARSWGAGVMLQPSRNIDLKLDYWNIRHEDLVGIDEDDFIRRALAGEFPVVGAGLLPTGSPGLEVTNGFVTDAHFQITNLGFQKTSGFDFAYTHRLPETSIGKFSLLLDATYLINFDRKASVDSAVEELAGDYLYPRFLANGRVRWNNGPWRASLSANYTSGYKDDPSPRTLEELDIAPGTKVKVDDYLTFDANLAFDLAKNSGINLNVRNIFDRDPPLVLGSSSNVDLFNHDLVGRFVTIRLTHRF